MDNWDLRPSESGDVHYLRDLKPGSIIIDFESKYDTKPIVWVLCHKNNGEEDYISPEHSVTLITKDIITLKAFDAKRPKVTPFDSDVGNNIYEKSSIHLWLNTLGSCPYDIAGVSEPNIENVLYNHYDFEYGFLSNLSEDLRGLMVQKKIYMTRKGAKPTVSCKDKAFLPSLSELGMLDNMKRNDTFKLFRKVKNRKKFLVAKPTKQCIERNNYRFPGLSPVEPWFWLTRSISNKLMEHSVAIINELCYPVESLPYVGTVGVRPCICVDNLALVEATLTDGVYRFYH